MEAAAADKAAAGMAAADTGAEAAADDATVDAAEVVAVAACPAEEEAVRVEAEEKAAPRHQPGS